MVVLLVNANHFFRIPNLRPAACKSFITGDPSSTRSILEALPFFPAAGFSIVVFDTFGEVKDISLSTLTLLASFFVALAGFSCFSFCDAGVVVMSSAGALIGGFFFVGALTIFWLSTPLMLMLLVLGAFALVRFFDKAGFAFLESAFSFELLKTSSCFLFTPLGVVSDSFCLASMVGLAAFFNVEVGFSFLLVFLASTLT